MVLLIELRISFSLLSIKEIEGSYSRPCPAVRDVLPTDGDEGPEISFVRDSRVLKWTRAVCGPGPVLS